MPESLPLIFLPLSPNTALLAMLIAGIYMRHLFVLMLALPAVALGQRPLAPRAVPVPAAVRASVGELAQICTSSGEKLARSPNLIQYVDPTGDDLTDYDVDAGSLNCDGAAGAMTSGQSGANLTVFVGGAANTAAKGYSGSVYANEIAPISKKVPLPPKLNLSPFGG
jgi:hypothetical protein